MKRHWGKVSLLGMVLFISLVILILSIGNSTIYAQSVSDNTKADLYWVNAGIGFSSFSSPGISSVTSFSYQTGKHLISTRFISNIEPCFGGTCPDETVWDIGILYGRSSKTSYGLASLSGGISIVGGAVYQRDEEVTFLTIGIPIEVQLFWTPASFLGIGIYGFANLNPKESFAGALLCIQLGKLR